MEFFHAKIYWSGRGEVITNVDALLDADNGDIVPFEDKYVILWISLKDGEVDALNGFLEAELKRDALDDEFENSMKLVFYNGSPIDSCFNLEKFIKTCKLLQIQPKMFYYKYENILTTNLK